jgi:hypothetical protein
VWNFGCSKKKNLKENFERKKIKVFLGEKLDFRCIKRKLKLGENIQVVSYFWLGIMLRNMAKI